MNQEKQVENLLGKLNSLDKSAALYFYSYIGFTFYSGFLLFSKHGGKVIEGVNIISIPILSTEIERWNALELILVFAFASLFKFTSLYSFSFVVKNKILQIGQIETIQLISPTSLSILSFAYPKIMSQKYLHYSFIILLAIPLGIALLTGWYEFSANDYLRLPMSWRWTMIIDFALMGLTLISVKKLKLSIQQKPNKPLMNDAARGAS